MTCLFAACPVLLTAWCRLLSSILPDFYLGWASQHQIYRGFCFGKFSHALHLGCEWTEIVTLWFLVSIGTFAKPGFYFLLRLQLLNLMSYPLISSLSSLCNHLLLSKDLRIYLLFAVIEVLRSQMLFGFLFLRFWPEFARLKILPPYLK